MDTLRENVQTYLSSKGIASRLNLIVIAVVTIYLTWLLQKLIRLIAKRIRQGRELAIFDGPPLHWLVGVQDKLPSNDKFLDHVSAWSKYGPAFKIRYGPFEYRVLLTDPNFVEVLAKTAESKSESYRYLEPWLGDGLLLSKGKKWARNRRLLTPAFHFDILKPYTYTFNECAHTLIAKWRDLLETEKSLEMFEQISLMTLDSLLKCIFSYTSNCQAEGRSNPYVARVYELSQLFQERFRFFPYHFDLLFYLSYMGYRNRRACRLVHAYSSGVIAARKTAKSQEHQKVEKKFVDFLDVLLDARDENGCGLTDTEIQHEVDTFLFEGHDTTASGISWCLYNLARHPEYQQRCRDEVNGVLEGRNHVTWDDLRRFTYLTMCIKESLRLHNPVFSITRTLSKPLPLPDGRIIPAGINTGLPIYSIHRNPKVWPDPDHYDPDRFSEENVKGRSPYAFIPFSAGPRNCIGKHFAMNEMQISLALILKSFNFELDESKPVLQSPQVILRARDGIWLRAKPV